MGKLAKRQPGAVEKAHHFTIQGIWQPAAPAIVRQEMRDFSSCVRWVFNRLQEIPKGEADSNLPVAEKPLNRIKRDAQRLFRLNSRRVADAMMEAKAIMASQKELFSIQIQNLEKRIENLGKVEKKALRILRKPDSVEATEKWQKTLESICRHKKKAIARQTEREAHIRNGTIPKGILGERRLLKRLTQSNGERHQVLRRKWRLARQRTLRSRGDMTKGGNPNARIESVSGTRFDLRVALSHQAECQGTDSKGPGRRLPLDSGQVPPAPHGNVTCSQPYSVRIMEGLYPDAAPFSLADSEGTVFRVHITVDRHAEFPTPKPDLSRGVLDLDENSHGIALANLGLRGNLEPFPVGRRAHITDRSGMPNRHSRKAWPFGGFPKGDT